MTGDTSADPWDTARATAVAADPRQRDFWHLTGPEHYEAGERVLARSRGPGATREDATVWAVQAKAHFAAAQIALTVDQAGPDGLAKWREATQ